MSDDHLLSVTVPADQRMGFLNDRLLAPAGLRLLPSNDAGSLRSTVELDLARTCPGKPRRLTNEETRTQYGSLVVMGLSGAEESRSCDAFACTTGYATAYLTRTDSWARVGDAIFTMVGLLTGRYLIDLEDGLSLVTAIDPYRPAGSRQAYPAAAATELVVGAFRELNDPRGDRELAGKVLHGVLETQERLLPHQRAALQIATRLVDHAMPRSATRSPIGPAERRRPRELLDGARVQTSGQLSGRPRRLSECYLDDPGGLGK